MLSVRPDETRQLERTVTAAGVTVRSSWRVNAKPGAAEHESAASIRRSASARVTSPLRRLGYRGRSAGMARDRRLPSIFTVPPGLSRSLQVASQDDCDLR